MSTQRHRQHADVQSDAAAQQRAEVNELLALLDEIAAFGRAVRLRNERGAAEPGPAGGGDDA